MRLFEAIKQIYSFTWPSHNLVERALSLRIKELCTVLGYIVTALLMTPLASQATCIFKECVCSRFLFCLEKTSNYVMGAFGFVQCVTPSVWNLTGPAHPAQHSRKDLGEEPTTNRFGRPQQRWLIQRAEMILKLGKSGVASSSVMAGFVVDPLCVFWLRIGSYFLPGAPKLRSWAGDVSEVFLCWHAGEKKLVLNTFFHCVDITFLATITAAICVFCDAETATAISLRFCKPQCVC